MIQVSQLKDLIKWSDPASPDNTSSYDHISANVGPFRFFIEWKSWKDFDSPVLYMNEDFIDSYVDVEHAKIGATKELAKVFEPFADLIRKVIKEECGSENIRDWRYADPSDHYSMVREIVHLLEGPEQ